MLAWVGVLFSAVSRSIFRRSGGGQSEVLPDGDAAAPLAPKFRLLCPRTVFSVVVGTHRILSTMGIILMYQRILC